MRSALDARALPGVRRVVRAVRRLGRPAPFVAQSGLQIPVTCTASLLGCERARALGIGGGDHLTIVNPFVPAARIDAAVTAAVAEVLSEFRPFAYELTRIDRFPDVLFLAPDPAEPFIAITEAMTRRFPEHPPYGGVFDTIVPHVSIAFGPERPGLAELVERELPLSGTAEEVWLVAQGDDRAWTVHHRFALGATSASPPAHEDGTTV